ncbi:MAG TPA: VOC family protein [Rhodanobacteraceae bacterium]
MSTTAEMAEKTRKQLIDKYILNADYSDVETQANGINHLAFITDKVHETIDFYTKVVGLKLLRVRPLDGHPESTMIFFDMGRDELLAFLLLADVHDKSTFGTGGVSHFALSITDEQFSGFKARAEARGIKYRTITHEILKSISAVDPNGLEVELSVWNMNPEDMSQKKELTHPTR